MFTSIHKYGWAAIAGGALIAIAGPLLDLARFGEPDANIALVRAAELLFVASVPGLLGGVPSHTFMCLVWGPLWALLGVALLQLDRAKSTAVDNLSPPDGYAARM